MKLFHAAASPFVRKCLVSAHELGLRERLELVPAAAHPVNRDRTLADPEPAPCARIAASAAAAGGYARRRLRRVFCKVVRILVARRAR